MLRDGYVASVRHDDLDPAVALQRQRAFWFRVPGWRQPHRVAQDGTAHYGTGVLDLPGQTWQDRPGVDQGDGVFLAGDEVAAPEMLAEVSFASAAQASTAGADALLRRPVRLPRPAPR